MENCWRILNKYAVLPYPYEWIHEIDSSNQCSTWSIVRPKRLGRTICRSPLQSMPWDLIASDLYVCNVSRRRNTLEWQCPANHFIFMLALVRGVFFACSWFIEQTMSWAINEKEGGRELEERRNIDRVRIRLPLLQRVWGDILEADDMGRRFCARAIQGVVSTGAVFLECQYPLSYHIQNVGFTKFNRKCYKIKVPFKHGNIKHFAYISSHTLSYFTHSFTQSANI